MEHTDDILAQATHLIKDYVATGQVIVAASEEKGPKVCNVYLQ